MDSANLGNNLKKKPGSPRSLLGTIMTVISGLCLAVTIIPLFAVLGFVFVQGVGRLNANLFTKLPPPPGLGGGGIANAILGTIIVVALATAIAVPIGVLAAVYLSEFSGDNKLAQGVRFATNVLAGVPSIIVGVFIRTTDEALKIVPQDIRWAAMGLGAYNYQTVLKIVLPAAVPAILTGVTLAIARAAGETASLIFTALFSNFWPRGVFEPIATLSVLVFNFATAPFAPQQQLAWAGALILVFLVLVTNILSRLATRQKTY